MDIAGALSDKRVHQVLRPNHSVRSVQLRASASFKLDLPC